MTVKPEARIQRAIVQYVRLRAVPDLIWGASTSGMLMAPRTAAHMKLMGMEPGWPDLMFVIGGRFFAIEMKSAKGRQSEPQKDFQRKLTAQGGRYDVVFSLDEAMKVLKAIGAVR